MNGSKVEFNQRRFLIFWTLGCYALPALLWVLLSAWLRKDQASSGHLIDAMLTAAFWTAVGSAQAFLLRGVVKHSAVWGVLTAISGMTAMLILGFFSSGYVFMSLSDWTPLASIGLLRGFIIGVVVGGSLGFFQLTYLRGGWRVRGAWMLANCLAGSVAVTLPLVVLRVLFFLVDSSWFAAIGIEHATLILQVIRIVGAAGIFGLITGYALKRLLRHHSTTWNESLVGQFD